MMIERGAETQAGTELEREVVKKEAAVAVAAVVVEKGVAGREAAAGREVAVGREVVVVVVDARESVVEREAVVEDVVSANEDYCYCYYYYYYYYDLSVETSLSFESDFPAFYNSHQTPFENCHYNDLYFFFSHCLSMEEVEALASFLPHSLDTHDLESLCRL